MGLSRNNADKESDWILDQHLSDSEPLDDHLNIDLVNKNHRHHHDAAQAFNAVDNPIGIPTQHHP